MLIEEFRVGILDSVDFVEVVLVGEDLVGGVTDDGCRMLVSVSLGSISRLCSILMFGKAAVRATLAPSGSIFRLIYFVVNMSPSDISPKPYQAPALST